MGRYSHGEVRNPLFCILPPHILRAIAQNGTPQQRARALDTLVTDQTIRALRLAQRMMAPASQPRAVIPVEEGRKQRTMYTARNTQRLPRDVVRREGEQASGD
jgi:hypothetical protein